MQKLTVTVELPEEQKMRADRYIVNELELLSRNQLKQRLVALYLNGKEIKPSKQVGQDDILELHYQEVQPVHIEPEPVDLDIIYENEHLLVINKPQGMVVHPAGGNYHHTLIQGVLYYCNRVRNNFADENIRPGIVHRLDKDTSGLILVAKDPETLAYLSKQFRKRRVSKSYIALIKNTLYPYHDTIVRNIGRDPHNRKRFTVTEKGGKEAITEYRVLCSFDQYSLVKLLPKTGRTHQLRVHMQAMHTPIVGDQIYSRKDKRFPEATLMLHSYRLSIDIGEGGAGGIRERRTFRAPLPDRIKTMIKQLSS